VLARNLKTSKATRSEEGLLGTLQIYSCDQRFPDSDEARLITQAVYLAAVALQREEHAAELAN
jgi:GAF domain-containing protein